MIRYARNHPLLVLALLALVVATTFLARPAAAQDSGVIGWTVEQGGRTYTYPLKDRWTLKMNPNVITLENSSEHATHHYFGTFRVIDRRK